MEKVRITVLKRTFNQELADKYGCSGLEKCELCKEGQYFISNGWEKPDGLCESAWQCMHSFVFALSHGSRDFLKDWMIRKDEAVISCNDGLRPVIFLLEAGVKEDEQ